MGGSAAYQDDLAGKRRVELIAGRAVMMSPRPSLDHNRVSYNIATLFANYLRGKACTPIADGTDLYLDSKNRFVPDFMVVCDPDKLRPDGVHGAPDLVAEVLSPSTARNDRTVKKEAYARCGVREYWLVSPRERSVEVYRNDGGELLLHDVYVLYPDWQLAQMTAEERAALTQAFPCGLFPGLEISLADVFYRLP